MKSLVDKNGKQFKPDLTSQIFNSIHKKVELIIDENVEEESKLILMMKLSALRESCGIEPKTLVFKRFIPYKIMDDV